MPGPLPTRTWAKYTFGPVIWNTLTMRCRIALSRDPYNFQAHLNLGQLFVRRQRWAEARQNLEFVMRYFPDEDPGIYSMLFHVDTCLRDPRAAAAAVRFGLRMFPGDPDLLRLKLPYSFLESIEEKKQRAPKGPSVWTRHLWRYERVSSC